METSFLLFVTYSQVAVFSPSLPNPFNDWTTQHFAQGFSWRPGSVSFRTLQGSGDLEVTVKTASEARIRGDAKRVIQVPFDVSNQGLVEIASIDTGEQVPIPEGAYSLVFETGYADEDRMWCCLTFGPRQGDTAELLRVDENLSPSYPLLMHASSA